MNSAKHLELLVVGLALATASCGARSELVSSTGASSGADGGGGGRVTTSSSTSSSGGAGGGPVVEACHFSSGGIGGAPAAKACGSLQARPDLVTIGADGEDDDQPSLVLVADAAPGVAAVYASRAAGGDANAKVALFDGWGSWPATLASEATIANNGTPIVGDDFSAVSHVGSTDRALMLAYQVHGKAHYAVDVSACDGKTHPPPFVSGAFHNRIDVIGPGTPVGAAPSSDRGTLVAGQLRRERGHYILQGAAGQVGVENVGGLSGMFACATTPISFAAVPTMSGWILGVAAGAPSGSEHFTCDESQGPAGPSTFLIFGAAVEWTPPPDASSFARPTDTLRAAATVQNFALLPAGDGARAIWSVDGESQLSTAMLDATAHVTSSGTLDLGVTIESRGFTAVALGRGFAVASPTDASSIHVAAFGGDGTMVGSADAPVSGAVEGRVQALAARDGSALLVSWAERPPGGGGRVLRMARFDCLAP